MRVVKAKNFDTSNLSLGTPQRIMQGQHFSIPIEYDGDDNVMIQLPRCQVAESIYEVGGKFYCEIVIPTRGVVNAKYFDIAFRIENLLSNYHRTGGPCTFLGHIRHMRAEKAQAAHASIQYSCLRLKLPKNKSQILTEVQNETGSKLSLKEVVKGATILPIVSLENAYIVNNTLGFNLLLRQVVTTTEEND
jgi:hypothetical protein